MTKKLTPAECPRKDVSIPRTRGQSEEAKKQGSMLGYLIRQPGRPPRSTSASASTAAAASSSTAAAVAGTKRDGIPFGCMTGTQKKRRKKPTNWEEHADILQAHVDARNNKSDVADTILIAPPRTTINDYVRRLANHKEATGENITVAEWIDQYKRKGGRNPIISKDVRDRIQDILVARDGRNNPMQRKDIIEIIGSVSGSTNKQADNYYQHCVDRKKFPLLKKGGKVCSAQKTTTSRTQVTMEQQHRWHTLIDQIWEKQEEVNLPNEEFKPVRAHFQLNLDEECVIGNDGTIKVIASNFGTKVQKNMDDFRGSITIIRVGSAGGGEGPVIFLCSGKDKSCIPIPLRGDLSKRGLPVGSCVIVSPTAYLTDEVWMECVPHICKGIRAMDIIKDHPEWIACLTLDGFGSHLQALAYEIFNDHNIDLVVEDGDTSQTNQAFDQQKAKEDKRNIRALLDASRYGLKVQLNQFSLISICIVALKHSTPSAWINSFIRVNLHPDHRLSFLDWIKKIESQVVAGESFFKRRTSLYDILPKFWRRMTPIDRRTVVTIIDGFYSSDEPTWCKYNVNELLEYVPLKDVVRLRACYWTAKQDESVMYRLREEVVDSDRMNEVEFDEKSLRGILDKYNWYPNTMTMEYGPRRKWDRETSSRPNVSSDVGEKWFKHITNNVAANHWSRKTEPLLPSSHLDCAIDNDQCSFFNPTMRDVILSTLELDSYGENAKKKRARRRMCMVDGNASSYSKQLNSTARMEKYADQNCLVAILAELRLEKEEEKKTAREKKEADDKVKEQHKLAKEIQKQQLKESLMPSIIEDVNRGLNFVLSKTNPRKKQILEFFYNVDRKELPTRKDDLNILITQKMTPLDNDNNSSNSNNNNNA